MKQKTLVLLSNSFIKHRICYLLAEEKWQLLHRRQQLHHPVRHLREARFAFPITLAPTPSVLRARDDDKVSFYLRNGQFTKAYTYSKIEPNEKTVADVVEEAARGIIEEGASLRKEKEAQWLADQLLNVKHFGDKLLTSIWTDIPSQIGEACVHLYTEESFWYRLINQILRQCETATPEQVKTMGPFCYLLHKYLEKNPTTDVLTTYRGLTLTGRRTQSVHERVDDVHSLYVDQQKSSASRTVWQYIAHHWFECEMQHWQSKSERSMCHEHFSSLWFPEWRRGLSVALESVPLC